MSDAPSGRQLEMLQRVAREEANDRRTIMKVEIAASVLLLASTLFAWENHPRVEHNAKDNPAYFIREVSHTMGLATKPAGLLAVIIALLALGLATRLRRVRLSIGWLALVLALAAVAVSMVEIIQLLLGRRNWLDHVTPVAGNGALSQAIGIGVWLATLASVALVANAATYLWLGYRLWRKNPAVTD
jgi:hypothetical protein